MKVISVMQPFATLLAIGAKKNETRGDGWKIKHTGETGIHASKRFPREYRGLCETEPFKSALSDAGFTADNLPLGKIIAVGNLVEYIDMTEDYIQSVPCPEKEFGWYKEGRKVLRFEGMEMLPEPIPAKGQLGIWNWDGEIK